MKQKQTNWLALVTFIICLLSSQNALANNAMLQLNFLKLAKFAEVNQAKKLFKSNPQIRSMANSRGDMRLIEEAMIESSGAKNASYDFVKLMIDNGADVNVVSYDGRGQTALENVIMKMDMYNDPSSFKALVDLGMMSRKTASREERIRIINLLIKEGADLDSTNIAGSPLIKIALQKDLKIAKILLEAGANPNPVNSDNQLSLITILKNEIKEAKETLALIHSLKGAK